jgi:hypothetical protein
MKNQLLRYIGIAALIIITAVSCRKDDFVGTDAKTPSGTLMKFLEGKEVKLFFAPFTGIKNTHFFSVRRDAANSEELQKPATIKLEQNAGIITKYNTANSEAFLEIPASFYSFSGDQGYTKTATGYDLTFSPGDFSKNFKINLDGSKWLDLGKKYAIAFRVTDWGGIKKSVGVSDTIMVFLSIKNKWDGVYSVSGTMTDVANTTLGHINEYLTSASNNVGVSAPMEFELRTISPTKCLVYDNHFFGGNYMPIRSGTTYSQYGSFSITVEFDPATDKVVAVTNTYGQPASNTRSGRLDPSGTVNAYDASSKTVTLKYNMLQPSVVAAAPHVRTTWDEVWTYKGARQ